MIRIGVIGYGYWGPNLARNFAETRDVELRAVSDLRPERLALARSRHPQVQALRTLPSSSPIPASTRW